MPRTKPGSDCFSEADLTVEDRSPKGRYLPWYRLTLRLRGIGAAASIPEQVIRQYAPSGGR